MIQDDDDKPTKESPDTILICVNRRFKGDQPSCAARGSMAIAEAIEAGVAERRIDIKVERIICFGHCTKGPNIRFAPGGRFNHETKLDDVPAMLDELQRTCGTLKDDDGPPLHLLGS